MGTGLVGGKQTAMDLANSKTTKKKVVSDHGLDPDHGRAGAYIVGVTCASTRYYLDPVRPWSKLDPPDHGLVGAYIG